MQPAKMFDVPAHVPSLRVTYRAYMLDGRTVYGTWADVYDGTFTAYLETGRQVTMNRRQMAEPPMAQFEYPILG